MLRSFEVIGNKGIFLELQLQQSKKIYNVFHNNLLRKVLIDLLSNHVYKPSLPVTINDKEEWEVKEILDTRSHRGKLQYQVKWVGWDKDRNCYNAERFENFPEIIQDFHACYPEKPTSKILAKWKSGKKRSWKLRIFFYYLLEGPYVLTWG